MTYHDRIFALAAFWKFGAQAEAVLGLLPVERREAILAAIDQEERNAPAAIEQRLRELVNKEARRVNRWGRRRWGSGWDRLDPRVRAYLVRGYGGNH